MSWIKQSFFGFALLLAGLLTCPANASVSLVMAADPVADTGTSKITSPGSSFSVSVELISTSTAQVDTVAGVSYQLKQTAGPSNGAFTLTARNLSTFVDANYSDAAVLLQLLPSNGQDLGATCAFDGFGLPIGPISNNFGDGITNYHPDLVASYTIGVSPTALPGAYTLSVLYPTNGTGYGYFTGSTFNDGAFSAPPGGSRLLQTFTVNVVPEPSTIVLLVSGLASLAILRWRTQKRASA